jgi:hypothetical protein
MVSRAQDAEEGWLYVACMLSTLCAALGDGESAAVVYPLLLPHAARIATLGPGVCCWGSVAHALGDLAATLGCVDDAVEHFDEALRAHERIAAPPLIASTAYAYGRTLLARGTGRDRDRATQLLGRAFVLARELGMDALATKAGSLADGAGTDGSASERVFRKEGDFWTVAYEGRTARIKDAKGLNDIALLLANPGKDIHVADLIAASEALPDARLGRCGEVASGRLAEQGLQPSRADTAPLLDRQARAEYRARLRDLRGELDEAECANDPGRADRVRAELDFIAGQLAHAHGLGGRVRAAGAPAERARQAVTWRIRQSVGRVERVHPLLATHLRRFIRTGTFCSYAVPEGSPPWRL